MIKIILMDLIFSNLEKESDLFIIKRKNWSDCKSGVSWPQRVNIKWSLFVTDAFRKGINQDLVTCYEKDKYWSLNRFTKKKKMSSQTWAWLDWTFISVEYAMEKSHCACFFGNCHIKDGDSGKILIHFQEIVEMSSFFITFLELYQVVPPMSSTKYELQTEKS